MTFESKKLRDASRGQFCVRCGNPVGVVGCHYTGVRRGSYGGGFGQKVHDFLTADLCPGCHSYMDSASRDKSKKWEHSEEFQHYIILTLERRFVQGVIVVSRGRHEVDTGSDPHPSALVADVVGQPMGLGIQVASHAAGESATGARGSEEAP